MVNAAPEVQWTMNTAVAQIGINFSEHRKRTIETTEKIGIYLDYPFLRMYLALLHLFGLTKW